MPRDHSISLTTCRALSSLLFQLPALQITEDFGTEWPIIIRESSNRLSTTFYRVPPPSSFPTACRRSPVPLMPIQEESVFHPW